MRKLRDFADVAAPNSLSQRFRARRMALLTSCLEQVRSGLDGRPLTVLDMGGTTGFWERAGWAGRADIDITVVNLSAQLTAYPNIVEREGDARRLNGYADSTVDLLFSNSVIEHLYDLEGQAAMAREVQRVGRHYWVQTPNYWFPLEPHFLFPGWQWAPMAPRVAALRRWRIGHRGPYPDAAVAEDMIREIRLMSRRELGSMFPEGIVVAERIGPLAKSYVVVSPQLGAHLQRS